MTKVIAKTQIVNPGFLLFLKQLVYNIRCIQVSYSHVRGMTLTTISPSSTTPTTGSTK